jgi:hypothetical protein
LQGQRGHVFVQDGRRGVQHTIKVEKESFHQNMISQNLASHSH